jgi:hypothetical protein
MIILFIAYGRLIFNTLPKRSKYNQNYFIDNLLSALNPVRTGNTRYKMALILLVHMNNSMCHNGAKITEKMPLKGLGRASHSAYSSNINPCDFWEFGTIRRMIKDRHLQDLEEEEILRAIQEAYSHFTFENFQNVFKS